MMWTILFFPIHLASITISSWVEKKENSTYILQEAVRKFFEEGISFGIFSQSLNTHSYIDLNARSPLIPKLSFYVSSLSPPTTSS